MWCPSTGYAYFDSNVAFAANLDTIRQLMKVLNQAISLSNYQLSATGVEVAHFNAMQANQALSSSERDILTQAIETERHRLSSQDQEKELLTLQDQPISRVTLYDLGA